MKNHDVPTVDEEKLKRDEAAAGEAWMRRADLAVEPRAGPAA